jgi:hypothetical protein
MQRHHEAAAHAALQPLPFLAKNGSNTHLHETMHTCRFAEQSQHARTFVRTSALARVHLYQLLFFSCVCVCASTALVVVVGFSLLPRNCLHRTAYIHLRMPHKRHVTSCSRLFFLAAVGSLYCALFLSRFVLY